MTGETIGDGDVAKRNRELTVGVFEIIFRKLLSTRPHFHPLIVQFPGNQQGIAFTTACLFVLSPLTTKPTDAACPSD